VLSACLTTAARVRTLRGFTLGLGRGPSSSASAARTRLIRRPYSAGANRHFSPPHHATRSRLTFNGMIALSVIQTPRSRLGLRILFSTSIEPITRGIIPAPGFRWVGHDGKPRISGSLPVLAGERLVPQGCPYLIRRHDLPGAIEIDVLPDIGMSTVVQLAPDVRIVILFQFSGPL
jgi:hypothetical protein